MSAFLTLVVGLFMAVAVPIFMVSAVFLFLHAICIPFLPLWRLGNALKAIIMHCQIMLSLAVILFLLSVALDNQVVSQGLEMSKSFAWIHRISGLGSFLLFLYMWLHAFEPETKET